MKLTLTEQALTVALICSAIFAGQSLLPESEDIARGIGHGIIHEDNVKWDCETMGNLICGPVEDSHIWQA